MSRVSIINPQFSRRLGDYYDFDEHPTKVAFSSYYSTLKFTKMETKTLDVYRANLKTYTTGSRFVALLTRPNESMVPGTEYSLQDLQGEAWVYFQTGDDFSTSNRLSPQAFTPPESTLLDTEMKYYDEDEHGTKYTCEELFLEVYLVSKASERWAFNGTVKKALEEYSTMVRFIW